MFGSLTRDLENGVDKVRWFAKTLSERAALEFSAIRLLYHIEELKKQRDELLKKIGQEVFDMRGKELNIYANVEVMTAISEVERLDQEIRETSEKVTEAGRPPE